MDMHDPSAKETKYEKGLSIPVSKTILIWNIAIPYTGSDDQWTVDMIEKIYSIIFERTRAKNLEKAQQEGKSTEDIDLISNEMPPLLYWYPLNSQGYYNYSLSKTGETLNHKTGHITAGSNIITKGKRLSMYSDVLNDTIKPYAHKLVAMFFVSLPPTPNSIVIQKVRGKIDATDPWGTREGMKYQKGLTRPVTMYSKPWGYSDYIPDITFFSATDGENYLVEKAEACGLEDFAVNIKFSGRVNILRACEESKNGYIASAYGHLWEYAGQGNSLPNKIFGEIWQPISLTNTKYFEVSNKARVRVCDPKQNF